MVQLKVGKESLHSISSVSCTNSVLLLLVQVSFKAKQDSPSPVFRSEYIHTMSGTALFTFFFFFFFFVHSAASPAGITMSSCLLLRFTPLPLQLASQCSAVTCPTRTRSKRVGNNTKLVCASGRQSVILVNHTSYCILHFKYSRWFSQVPLSPVEAEGSSEVPSRAPVPCLPSAGHGGVDRLSSRPRGQEDGPEEREVD
jgi:hypothetical protein